MPLTAATASNMDLVGSMLVVRQTIGVTRRILVKYLRQRRILVFWAAFPALMLLLFGTMYANNPAMPGSIDTTPAGILIGAALFFSCLGGTVSIIVAERGQRWAGTPNHGDVAGRARPSGDNGFGIGVRPELAAGGLGRPA
jgi:hypothetical protein